MTVRVRFAPSPTGELHVGGARTALFNWLFARREGGVFVLRIEDTDRNRSAEEFEASIMEDLRWLGLVWDEGPDVGGPYGPYRQSERAAVYREEAEKLFRSGRAYPCYCPPEELEKERQEFLRLGRPPRYSGRCRDLGPEERARLERKGVPRVVRVAAPAAGETVVQDLIRGRVAFPNAQAMDDFVILKSDGLPTYNFACVVDDARMRITHVLRAEEHLSNTPRQILLYELLGYPPPRFAHLPMILAPDRSKLSKRHGATAVREYREMGFLPEAVVNYLALLGWSPGGEEEFFSLEELSRLFSLERVGKTASVYDVEKMAWFNGRYLRRADLRRLARLAWSFFRRAGLVEGEPDEGRLRYVEEMLRLGRERIRTLGEAPEFFRYFFRAPEEYDPEGVRKHFSLPSIGEWLGMLGQRLKELPDFGPAAVESAYRSLAGELGIPAAVLIHATRLAVTGRTVGPGLFELVSLLGREEVLSRLERARDWIRQYPRPEEEKGAG